MRCGSLVCAAALFAAAAGYFCLSAPLGLEWVDTGLLVYPSWRVAAGAVPYLDFQHLYGPSSFLLNGVLLRWLGDDLFVLRAALVLRKALTAVLVYACTRQVASAPLAFAAYLLTVAVWGAPWWLFNTPYPNHDALTLVLLALWLIRLPHGAAMVRFFGAGVCIGLAATFKQTSGVFAWLVIALFALGIDAAGPRGAPRWPAALLQGIRAAVVLTALATVLLYAVARNTAWNVLALFLPTLLLIGGLAVREWRGRTLATPAASGVRAIVFASAGASLPCLVLALWYGAHGLFAALVFNVAVLPRALHWFVPVPLPTLDAAAIAAAAVATVAAVRRGGRTGVALLACAALSTALALLAAAADTTVPFGSGPGWHGPLFRAVALLPVLVAWLALPAALGRADESQRLYAIAAVISLLLLYPAADFWHVVMALPLFVPALAAAVDTAPGWRRAVIAGAIALLALPFVDALRVSRAAPISAAVFAKASGIVALDASDADAAAAVAYLRASEDGNGRLLVLCNQSLLYYLADRPSAVERTEYLLYLLGSEIIAPAAARQLQPESELLIQLDVARPLVLDCPHGGRPPRLAQAYPGLLAYVATHYRQTFAAGPYRVLAWEGG